MEVAHGAYQNDGSSEVFNGVDQKFSNERKENLTKIEDGMKVTSISKQTEVILHLENEVQPQQQRQSGGDSKPNRFTIPRST